MYTLLFFFFLGSLTLTLLQIREEAHREERVDGKIKLILGERFGIWLLYCKLKEKDKVSQNIRQKRGRVRLTVL
uniref:Secreted protein n=1 Tax=Astatotilapia calliptera TaxID=8154 RepID=A0A3P8PQ96_ASTCA